MINKLVKIKSGIDINSNEFREYYRYLKINNINTMFLDFALSQGLNTLVQPAQFKDNTDSIDDIFFVWDRDEIIGHCYINITKKRIPIHTNSSIGMHLDENIQKNNHIFSVSKYESFCKNDMEINYYDYIERRKNSELESIGMVSYEKNQYLKK